MKRIFSLVGLFVFMVLWAACERTLEVEVPEEPPRLVVNSLFAPYKPLWEITFTQSQPTIGPVNQDFLVHGNVHVTIQEDGRTIYDSTYTAEGARWIALPSLRPQAGKTYRLQASSDSLGAIEAETTVPPPVTVRAEPTSSTRSPAVSWRLEIDDLPEVGAYMAYPSLIVYYAGAGSGGAEAVIPYQVVAGTVVVPAPAPDAEDEYYYDPFLFDDRLFTDKTGWIEWSLDSTTLDQCGHPNVDSCHIRWTVITLSEDAERYLRSYQAAQNRGGLFEAPATIYSNVKNGIGIWAATNRSTIIR